MHKDMQSKAAKVKEQVLLSDCKLVCCRSCCRTCCPCKHSDRRLGMHIEVSEQSKTSCVGGNLQTEEDVQTGQDACVHVALKQCMGIGHCGQCFN